MNKPLSRSFFQTQEYLRARLKAFDRRLGFRAASIEEWRIWRYTLQRTLRQLLGVDRMMPADLNPRITETVQRDGYRREHVLIDTEPGVTMPLYVLIPDGLSGPTPAVIAAHGHSSGGKYAPAGRVDIPEIAETVREHSYDYGVQAVHRGYVVFCPDARGFGERRESFSEKPEQLLESSCRQLAHMGLPLGLTVAGMWAWDLSRLIDYIATRPECQGMKVGCIGLSGGGLQTLYLSALDERVACAVISGYFYGVDDSLLYLSDNCDCNYVPRLWEYVDMGDLGALIAPRPLLIESARQDPLNGPRGIDNVIEQVDITRRAYDLLGAGDKIAHDMFDGGHTWHGTLAMAWLEEKLCPKKR